MRCCKAFLIIFALYIMAVAIVTIVLVATSQKTNDKNDTFYGAYRQMYKTPAITDIRGQFTHCQAPYYPLFTESLAGIKTYCVCNSRYTLGNCNSKSQRYCRTVHENPGTKLLVFKGVFLCATRSPANYDSIVNADSGGNCPNDQKLCGRDSALGLCYPNSLDCPINDVIFQNSEDASLEQDGYKKISILGHKVTNPDGSQEINPRIASGNTPGYIFYIYFTNKKKDNRIVTDFKLGYKGICFDLNEEKTPQPQSELFSKQYKIQCSDKIGNYNEDPRLKAIGSVNKKALWRENFVFTNTGPLPGFSIQSIDYDLTLYSRPYFYMNQKCANKLKSNSGGTKSGLMNELMVNKSSGYSGYAIGIYVLCGFIILGSCCFCCARLGSEGEKNSTEFCLCLGFIILLVAIVLSLVSTMTNKSQFAYSAISEVGHNNCGDKITNEILKNNEEDSFNALEKYSVLLGLLALAIVLYFVYIFYWCCCGGKDEREYDRMNEHHGSYNHGNHGHHQDHGHYNDHGHHKKHKKYKKHKGHSISFTSNSSEEGYDGQYGYDQNRMYELNDGHGPGPGQPYGNNYHNQGYNNDYNPNQGYNNDYNPNQGYNNDYNPNQGYNNDYNPNQGFTGFGGGDNNAEHDNFYDNAPEPYDQGHNDDNQDRFYQD